MLLALARAALIVATLPSLHDHFPNPGSTTHDFLLIDAQSKEVLRGEGRARHAWGDLVRVVDALAGLEEGTIDAERVVRCDSTCWAAGAHGDVALVEAIAWDCDTWYAAQRDAVSSAARARHAQAVGLADEDTTGSSSAAQWVEFFRRLERDQLHLSANTSTSLLAAAGTAVSSPRGAARALHDEWRRTRAFVGGGAEGAWVVGSRAVLGRDWIFALFLPNGTPALATARADQLLEETRRVARRSTAERGGVPTHEPK